MTVTFSPASRQDIREIARFIMKDNPRRARSFVDELKGRCARLAENSKLYPLRDDITAGLRMVAHGDYLIFYRETDGGVRIERILHGARDYTSLF